MSNISKQTLKTLNILMAVGFAIVGIISIIISASGFPKLVDSAKTLATISLAFGIAILAFSVVGIVVNAVESDFAKYFAPIMLFIIAIGNLVVGIAVMDIANKAYGGPIPMSTELIYTVVAVVVMAILAIVAIFLNKSLLHDNSSKLFSLIGYVLFFNLITVTFVTEPPVQPLNLVDRSFNLIVAAFTVVVLFVDYLDGLNPYVPSKSSISGSKIHIRNTSSIDERLEAIKNLYEKGLITQEEFERKREEILRNV